MNATYKYMPTPWTGQKIMKIDDDGILFVDRFENYLTLYNTTTANYTKIAKSDNFILRDNTIVIVYLNTINVCNIAGYKLYNCRTRTWINKIMEVGTSGSYIYAINDEYNVLRWMYDSTNYF